jgi:putative membrane protein
MKAIIGLSAAVLLALAGSSAASAKGGDSEFVTKAAQGGMEEVELGQLASSNAASADVKQFGQRMVTDHGKANEELKSIAQKSGDSVPSGLSKKQESDKARLSKLNGAEFDKAYMKMMVSDHKEDVAEFEKEAKSGKDSDVKAFASKTLPTLKEHLQMAEQVESKVASGK